MMRSALLALVLACALTSCGSDVAEPDAADSDSAETPTGSETATASETPTATPTEVAFGYTQAVLWAPTADVSGELSISVEKVRAGDFADFEGLVASGITEANKPFYADVVIANEGDADFGGLDVPLYLEDSHRVLSPPWGFATPFAPCDSGPLPVPFGPGEEAELCLVFFASPRASFESVTFQPTLDTAAVSWTGDLTVEKTSPTKKQAKKRR
jgi:hypothetical protein